MKFLFVIDPIKNINPLKDSTAALMQASSNALDNSNVLSQIILTFVNAIGYRNNRISKVRMR